MCFKRKRDAVADVPRTGMYRQPKVHDDIVKLHGSVIVTPPSDAGWLNPVVDPASMQPYGNEKTDDIDEIDIDEE